MKRKPTYMYALIIGMTLAMRYAELHALKWSDVDFDDKSLLVKGQRTLDYEYQDGKFVCKGRKDKDTLKGNEEPRILPITPDVEEALKNIRALNLSDEYVFPDGHFRYHTYNDKVKQAAEAVGLNGKEYRTHSARTTAATNLYNECKDIYVVQCKRSILARIPLLPRFCHNDRCEHFTTINVLLCDRNASVLLQSWRPESCEQNRYPLTSSCS